MKMCLNEKNFKIKIIFLFERCSKNRKLSRFEEYLLKTECSRIQWNGKEGSKIFQMFLETSFDFLLFFSFCITQTQFAFVLFKGKKLGGENLSPVMNMYCFIYFIFDFSKLHKFYFCGNNCLFLSYFFVYILN